MRNQLHHQPRRGTHKIMEQKKPNPIIPIPTTTPKSTITIKGPIRYKFYCKICGIEIRTGKKHTQTCGATCRVTLSNIMRYGVEDASEEITPEQRKEIDLKVAHAKGANVDIPNPNAEPSSLEKIIKPSKAKKKDAPPIDPNLVPVADPTPGSPVPAPLAPVPPPQPPKS